MFCFWEKYPTYILLNRMRNIHIYEAADCLSRLLTPTSTSINMLTASSNDGPAFHTGSHTQHTTDTTSTPHPDTTPQISQEPTTTPKTTHSWMPYYKCKELTHSANAFLEDYWMAKHLTMNLTPSPMLRDLCTNTSWMLVRDFSPWSFLNLGNTQYLWKPMIN